MLQTQLGTPSKNYDLNNWKDDICKFCGSKDGIAVASHVVEIHGTIEEGEKAMLS